MANTSKFILFFFLFNTSAYGQTKNLILTREDNNKWIDSLKVLSLNQQLQTIKDRLISDTNVFVKQIYPDGLRIVNQVGNRVYGDGKPLIIIGGKLMDIDNTTDTKKIIGLSQLLDTINIKKIDAFNGNDLAMKGIYGSSAQNGIIIMYLVKKKYLKRFIRLKLIKK